MGLMKPIVTFSFMYTIYFNYIHLLITLSYILLFSCWYPFTK
jgi:hypothetical protein